ncbi:MAG: alpha/beta hydrolase [Candidatus Didemnitutus sp.]|nr:alpha/beta hydrolase [Candidatus Didemnitutus sp.]
MRFSSWWGWLGFVLAVAGSVAAESPPAPLVIGETFTVESRVLGETRRINVYLPAGYAETPALRVPVLYMPDGGLAEDFIHVAGLVQIGAANGTMRPMLLVGIENTQRRRDLTPPTESERDRKIAPIVGGAAAFRKFLREELMPLIRERYRTTDERAIVGESLAGLFVVDTLLSAPELFDTYIAIDPSLWWNEGKFLASAPERLAAVAAKGRTLWLAAAEKDGNAREAHDFAAQLKQSAPAALRWSFVPFAEERHLTIYHPAALRAFREVLAPRE